MAKGIDLGSVALLKQAIRKLVSDEIAKVEPDLSTGATATGTASSGLPSTSTALAPRGYISVGGTSSVIGLALMRLYIETDY